jgi:DsbE subfamily thiol:disulfide oxidoreductase
VPCRAEHPLLFTLAKDNRLEIDGIAYKNKQSDTNAYLAELGNPYVRVVVDEPGRTAIDFGIYGVPESYLVDRDGMIRFRQVGPLTEDVIEKQLKPLIAELAK